MKRIIDWLKTLPQESSEYRLASWLFLKILALIYLAAFLSLTGQINGLVGSGGILPLEEMLHHASGKLGTRVWLDLPTLFWLDSSDASLTAATWLGALFAVALFFGWMQRFAVIVLFILYLSLANASQLFLNFQWDYLLLECGFLAIFLAGGASRLIVLLFHWLLFRLRFMSGLAKLASGDPSWWGLTALSHYFETQPLPHVGSWYAHQLPAWLLQAGTALTLFSELIVPFFIFLPRRWRLLAAAVTITMQLLIIATSNHNFINLLTIALCLFLLDDQSLTRFTPDWMRNRSTQAARKPHWLNTLLLAAGAMLILSSTLPLLFTSLTGIDPGKSVMAWSDRVRRFGIGHAYHIFPTMQTERIELIIEGSMDGNHWYGYALPWQPSAPERRPPFIVPHHPRLDWMMWFVPTQQPPGSYLLERLLHRLAQGSPQVSALFATDPFGEKPPDYLRVLAYRYRFSTAAERRATGDWWQREYLGIYPWIAPRSP
ncbi:MAG: lipase maturation factor family protein [Chromatiaceae bacterium]|nr:lipase maturation factor family protein [Chromatiaceae bacterium]